MAVEARGAEVLADVLRRMEKRIRRCRCRIRGRLLRAKERAAGATEGSTPTNCSLPGGVGKVSLPGPVVGHQRDGAEAPVLAEALVVAEEEELVCLDRPAERAAELVALEDGDGALVEVVSGVKSAVADELECGAVDLVGAAGA